MVTDLPDARQFVLDLPFIEAYGAEDFLPAASNRQALDAVLGWPRWPTPALLIHGPEGAGKTHLVRLWAARSGCTVLGPAELSTIGDPLRRTAGARAVAVEHADCVAEEEQLFHLYNEVVGRGGHLLLTARASPGLWRPVLPDLRSRLQAAWNVAIEAPDDALLAAVLLKQFADRQLRVDQEVMHYVLQRMERSFAGVRRVVDLLDRASLGARRPITTALVREVLLRLEQAAAESDDPH
jgi:chromosomal replication initiation ATPase DnaA